jgi:hypothetical protein
MPRMRAAAPPSECSQHMTKRPRAQSQFPRLFKNHPFRTPFSGWSHFVPKKEAARSWRPWLLPGVLPCKCGESTTTTTQKKAPAARATVEQFVEQKQANAAETVGARRSARRA